MRPKALSPSLGLRRGGIIAAKGLIIQPGYKGLQIKEIMERKRFRILNNVKMGEKLYVV